EQVAERKSLMRILNMNAQLPAPRKLPEQLVDCPLQINARGDWVFTAGSNQAGYRMTGEVTLEHARDGLKGWSVIGAFGHRRSQIYRLLCRSALSAQTIRVTHVH